MNDMQKDWPADADNDDLARLAAQLPAAVPGLSPEALARVHGQMEAELDQLERWRRRRRFAFGASIAAAILVSLGVYAFMRPPGSVPAPMVDRKEVSALIEERITVVMGDAVSPPTDKPLVRLDDNRSLFTD